MTRTDAIDAARRAAQAAGRALADYHEPTAELDGGRWLVRFDGRDGAPGHHFLVVVEDDSGHAELHPGR